MQCEYFEALFTKLARPQDFAVVMKVLHTLLDAKSYVSVWCVCVDCSFEKKGVIEPCSYGRCYVESSRKGRQNDFLNAE